jgi:integrase
VPHVFEVEQVLKLLGAAKSENESDWLLILVTFLHALRASEAVGLKPSNVIGTKLKLKRLKGSRGVEDELLTHENPLLNEGPALFDLCRKTPSNQRLFPISSRTFQRRVHRYGEEAGLPELYCHPHTLKHSILTYLAENMELPLLQKRSGHVELGSLGIYIHPKTAVVEQKVSTALALLGV